MAETDLEQTIHQKAQGPAEVRTEAGSVRQHALKDQVEADRHLAAAAGVISPGTTAAKEIVVSARNGFPWQASLGAAVEEFEYVKQNQNVIVNGRW